jgi:flagellar biosynthesis protein FlhB
MIYVFGNNKDLIICIFVIMAAIELRHKLQELMKYTNDLDLAKAFDEFVEKYKREKSTSVLTKAQQKEVDRIRERHLSGESKSYSWQEIKQELIDKHGLQA